MSVPLDAPIEILVALAWGFVAYQICYYGYTRQHDSTDKIARTAVFATVSILTYRVGIAIGINPIASLLGMLPSAVACAIAWRSIIAKLILKLVRRYNLSYSVNQPSAWLMLQSNSKILVSELSVKLKDGKWILCEDTSRFSELPFGPAILGHSGDVAMYATHIEDADGTLREQSTVITEHGARILYLPASTVEQVAVRFLMPSRASTSASLLGAKHSPSAEGPSAGSFHPVAAPAVNRSYFGFLSSFWFLYVAARTLGRNRNRR